MKKITKNTSLILGVGAIVYFVYQYNTEIKLFFEKAAQWLFPSNQDRNGELMKLLLTIIGGLGVLYSLHLAYKRLLATNKGLELQTSAISKQSEQLELSRKGQVDERFKNAVEHLGSDKVPIILGGIVELHQIAKEDNEKYASVVFNILTSYLRSVLNVKLARNENYSTTIPQTIVDFLFRGNDIFLYKGYEANLSHCNFNSININGANLNKSDLSFSLMPMSIIDVSFENAKFSRTDFTICSIDNVNFKNVEFHDCIFKLCEIKNTDFSRTEHITTLFINSKFFDCKFIKANLYDSKFLLCHFETTFFTQAELLQVKYLGSNFIKTDFSENETFSKVDFIGSGFYETTFRSICHNCNFSGIRTRYQFDFIQMKDIEGNIGKSLSRYGIKELNGNSFLKCQWDNFTLENYNLILEECNTSESKWEAKYKKKEKPKNKQTAHNTQ